MTSKSHDASVSAQEIRADVERASDQAIAFADWLVERRAERVQGAVEYRPCEERVSQKS